MRNLARVTILGAMSLILSGCTSLTAEQRMWLREGKRAYDRGQFSEAIRMSSLFLSNAADRPEAGRALYVRGLSRARSGRRVAAYADLRAAAGESDAPHVSWRAEFAIGELSFEDGNWSQAQQHYASAIAQMRPIPPMDRGLYRLAVAAQRMGRWDESRRYFTTLVRRFSRSGFADPARRILRYRPRYFSLQCGAFARSKNADLLRLQLSRKDLDAAVRREDRGGRNLYIVYSGRYSTYAAAQQGLADNIENVPDAVIWP